MQRIGAFDGLRAIAALWVALFHLAQVVDGFAPDRVTQLATKGYLGVDVFFILSGFVLAYVYCREADNDTLDKGRFYWARLARIYPMHVLTFVAVLGAAPLNALYWGGNGPIRTDFPTAIGNLLLVHSWGLFDKLSWNFPSWSLSAEWGAYLIFPGIMGLSLFIAKRPLVLAALALGLIGVFGLWVFFMTDAGRVRPFDITYDGGLLRVGAEFCTGILLYRLYRLMPATIPGAAQYWVTPLVLISTLLVLHFDWDTARILQDVAFVALAALLILSLSIGKSPVDRLLQTDLARYLGSLSYGFYLWHGAILLYVLVLLETDTNVGRWMNALMTDPTVATGLAIVVSFIALTTLLSALSYRFFETPTRNLMRKWWNRRFPALPRTTGA